MQRRERTGGLATTRGEHRAEWNAGGLAGGGGEELPAHRRGIAVGGQREELLEEHLTLMGRLPLQPCVQLSRREARGGAEETGRIDPEIPRLGQRFPPGTNRLGLSVDSNRAERPAARLQPAPQQAHGASSRPHQQGERGDALLLSPTLVPLERLVSEGVAARLQGDRGHGDNPPSS
jgi:hypothetical protein